MSSLPSGIRDNHTRGPVAQFLREKIVPGSKLSVVSAYFTIHAYETLAKELDAIGELRFLFGEPQFVRALDPDRTIARSFVVDDHGLAPRQRLEQSRVARECAEWITRSVMIRSVRRSNLLHGKMYHVAHNGAEDAIVGSSNFTMKGLGLSTESNIELNLIVDSNRDRADLRRWFDELWSDPALVEDVTQTVLEELNRLYRDNDPQFIYFKTLFHVFDQYLTDRGNLDLIEGPAQFIDTAIWNSLFEFQRDGAKAAINKLMTHNGCIVADSVGLGKTYLALAVIKYFELRNYRVLVLCPKKLRENWTVYQAQNNSELNPFLADRFGYTVLAHTDLSRTTGRSGDIDLAAINWGNYDLVVIDESHNFRNNTRGRIDEEGRRISSRYERLMNDILATGVRTRVLLLSATPVNNNLRDLRNQIHLITAGDDRAFAASIGITSVAELLAGAQRVFTEWAKQSPQYRRTTDLVERLGGGFFTLLDELTIARSRKHVVRYYSDTLAKVGRFPDRLRPISTVAEIDTRGKFLSYDELNEKIEEYRLSLFNPSEYLLTKFRDRYDKRSGRGVRRVEGFTQEEREHYLIGMMKVNFLKRLESSVHSFAISMERTIAKIEGLEKLIHRFKKIRAKEASGEIDSEVDVSTLGGDDPEDEELAAAWEVGGKLKFRLEHLDVDRWLADLSDDKYKLEQLQESARKVNVERDAKLRELKQLIAAKVDNPTTDADERFNRKVLVFTAFADTAEYLYNALESWALARSLHIAKVSGDASGNRTTFGRTGFGDILINFSPRSKRRDCLPSFSGDGEIDLLIATDCISEGQNLQDCDYLVNYDIHWNPVRLIQRFGRIDRIGSRNLAIQMVNFWPTDDLNKYINLKNRVEARMALVDLAATSQEDILTSDEIRDLIHDELNYRDRQLLRLKNEVLDLEDFNENVVLNEFTLDDFRMQLLRFIEANRALLEEAPLGLYAVVPAPSDHPIVRPGVLFCLRRRMPREEASPSNPTTVNPLEPYFLVYIRDDGEVRYNFTQPKSILEIYRSLCAEHPVPYDALCRIFEKRIGNGDTMDHYDTLLRKAVAAIGRGMARRTAAGLASRGGRIGENDHHVRSTDDLELITWLVISEHR